MSKKSPVTEISDDLIGNPVLLERINVLDLGPRAGNGLTYWHNIYLIGQLVTTPRKRLLAPNLGPKTLQEIEKALLDYCDLKLEMAPSFDQLKISCEWLDPELPNEIARVKANIVRLFGIDLPSPDYLKLILPAEQILPIQEDGLRDKLTSVFASVRGATSPESLMREFMAQTLLEDPIFHEDVKKAAAESIKRKLG